AREEEEAQAALGLRPGRRLRALAREIEEGHRYDRRGDRAALALDGPLDRDLGAGCLESPVERAERNHLLDRRAPADRGRAPDLPSLTVDRDRIPVDDGGDGRR